LKAFIRNNAWFFLPYFAFLGLAAFLLIKQEKGSLNIFLDKHHLLSLDHFFVQYTNLGDGIAATAFCFLMLFVSARWFIGLSGALISVSLISQLLKRLIDENMRPRQFFLENYQFREIAWLDPHLWHSMPSGHTMAAFCLFAFLAFISRKKSYGYVCIMAAVLVGFSRIYLAQHFLADVVAGSILGIIVAVIFYRISSRMEKYPFFDQPFIRL
jgi:membrane-associated phospholipid phosphatase